MGTWGGTILSQTKLCTAKSGDTTTITVGNNRIAAIAYNGSAGDGTIDSEVTAVTDIDDPAGTGGWTDLVDLTGGPYAIAFAPASVYEAIGLGVQDEEDSGDSLRLQVLKDGDIILDIKAVGNNTAEQKISCSGTCYGTDLFTPSVGAFYCESSFKIRVARKGAFVNFSSSIAVPQLNYNEVEKL